MLENTKYATIKLLSSVKAMRNIPRYGHTRDFTLYFSQDKSLQEDYSLGLILVFALLMVVAVIWFLSLLILRILGHRIGCAAGRPATIPAEPMNNKSGSINTNETGEFIVMQADQNRVNRTRIVFFLSVMCALGACGAFLFGIIWTQGTLQDFYGNVDTVRDLFAAMPANLDKTFTESSEFLTMKTSLQNDLSTSCVGTGTEANDHPATITANLRASLEGVSDISLDPTWTKYNNTVVEMNDLIGEIVGLVDFVEGTSWYYIFFLSTAGLTAILTIYLEACAWRSGKEGYEFVGEAENTLNTKFLNFIAVPVFALLIAGTWFVTSVAMTTLAANGDFCYAEITTGNEMLKILELRGFDESTDFYKHADEYLHGCANGKFSAMASAAEYNATLLEAKTFIDAYTNLDVATMDAQCTGTPDADSIMTEVKLVSAGLDDLITQYTSVHNSMSCERIAPLVQKSVYEISCNSMSSAFLWVFVSGLLLAVFGSFMISLRSATRRPQIYLVPSNGKSRDDDSYIVDSDDDSRIY